MIKTRSFGCNLIGIGVFLFLLDFPLLGVITTNRIAFLFILIGFILLYSSNTDLGTTIPKHYFRPFITSAIFSLVAVFISTVYHMTTTVYFITSFLLVGMILILTYAVRKYDGIKIIRTASIFSFIFILLLTAYSISQYGFFAFNSFGLRIHINSIGPGLSRIINGVTYANVLILLYFKISRKSFSKILFLFSWSLCLWLILSTQSRQGLIFHVFSILGFGIILYPTFRHKKLALILIFLSLGVIFLNLMNSAVFENLFLERTVEQLETGEGSASERIGLVRRGIFFIENNFFLGVGPGNFINIVGKDAHNGYLRQVAETGVLALVGICIVIFYTLIKGKYSLFSLLISVIILGAPLFNSIYDNPMFWSVLILSVYTNESTRLARGVV